MRQLLKIRIDEIKSGSLMSSVMITGRSVDTDWGLVSLIEIPAVLAKGLRYGQLLSINTLEEDK